MFIWLKKGETISSLLNRWFDNLYSFLHPAKHGFLFILKNVLFKDIHVNDTETPITFSKKMISKNQCLAIFCIWGWNVPCKKTLIQFKAAGNLAFFSNRKLVRLRMRRWSENERGKGEENPSMETTVCAVTFACEWVFLSAHDMMTSVTGSNISLP